MNQTKSSRRVRSIKKRISLGGSQKSLNQLSSSSGWLTQFPARQLLLHSLNPSLSCISITRAGQWFDFMHMHIDMSVSHENDLLEDHGKSGSCSWKSDTAGHSQNSRCTEPLSLSIREIHCVFVYSTQYSKSQYIFTHPKNAYWLFHQHPNT